MEHNRILKPSVIAPPLFGLAVGAVMFWIGATDGDAPGLCLLGLVIAFLLIMLGTKNSGLVPKGFILPIILLCFGAGGVLLGIAWFMDTEFDSTPFFPVAALCFGIAILCAGILQTRRRIRSKQQGSRIRET